MRYPAPSGDLAAYLSLDPNDGAKHPAIVWIKGGDCNSIGDVWSAAPPENDQTAAVFRQLGVVTMYPALRGGNQNPGVKESFWGEVDDVIAAAEFLARQTYVDPQRIYLGGHDTGGTLVLLVAEMTDRFRGVFSFGPMSYVADYGADPSINTFDVTNPSEVMVRSPGCWLPSIHSPVWVIEGKRQGNVAALRKMSSTCKNPFVHFVQVTGADHHSLLAPVSRLIAQKINADLGPVSNLKLTSVEASQTISP